MAEERKEGKVAGGKRKKREEAESGSGRTGLIGGVLELLGVKIDLGELLDSPEEVTGKLAALRERLKQAGGVEVTSDEEWRRGEPSVSGFIRTRGLLGDREFHLGTMSRGGVAGGRKAERPEPPDVVEPPVDVFDEGDELTIVADVPGVGLEDLELKVEGGVFSLAARPGAGRNYQKELQLEAAVDPKSMRAICRNGALEVRLRKMEQ